MSGKRELRPYEPAAVEEVSSSKIGRRGGTACAASTAAKKEQSNAASAMKDEAELQALRDRLAAENAHPLVIDGEEHELKATEDGLRPSFAIDSKMPAASKEWFDHYLAVLMTLVLARMSSVSWLGEFKPDPIPTLDRMNMRVLTAPEAASIARAATVWLYEALVNRLLPFMPHARVTAIINHASSWFANGVKANVDTFLVSLLVLVERLQLGSCMEANDDKPLAAGSGLAITMEQVKAMAVFVGFALFDDVLGACPCADRIAKIESAASRHLDASGKLRLP